MNKEQGIRDGAYGARAGERVPTSPWIGKKQMLFQKWHLRVDFGELDFCGWHFRELHLRVKKETE